MTATVMIALLTLAALQPEETCALARVERAKTLSSTCLSCHDGGAAPAITPHDTRVPGSHPVSVPYASARAAVSLRRSGPRDPAVVLPAGRVECVTCHAADGQGPHRTVLATAALCTGCHEK